ncbi:gluconate 2-dehydrogenase subunit 3 family protein [Paenibacillus validus]|uniref:gluconate 2-dehydrogenase subunit 3 family protein n=1 Tax=Paenibacillus validus TaxID=44253 RepID=UPI003D2E6A91
MSIKRFTRYPSYDVMSQRHEWDEHTRRIVLDRLQTGGGYTFLTAVEAENLRAWCCLLLDDERPEIIQFVLDHIDTKMNSGQESQRKPGEPPAPALVRNGLQALDSACQRLHTKRFFHMDQEQKKQIMHAISQGDGSPPDIWRSIPQQAWFQKLLTLAIDGYYSHPEVWSEIGYGGPAYPRGYVRMNPDVPDPWEPIKEGKPS